MIDIVRKRKSGIVSGTLMMVLIFMITACGSTRDKTAAGLNDFSDLRELVNNREFQIENQWALPLSGSNINLIGNANYIRFERDSVDLFLPYFGVRHSGGGYNRDGGIRYEGPLEDLEIEENPNEKHIRIKFDGRQNSEDLDFSVTIYPNGNTYTSVTSSQRNSISYRGEVGDLPEEQD